MRLRSLRLKRFKRQNQLKPPGTAPGTLIADPHAPKPVVTIIAYSDDGHVEKKDATIDDVRTMREKQLAEGGKGVLWVNVDGLGDSAIVQQLGDMFHLHKLALEDALSVHQRAKVDQYPDNLFIVIREPQPTVHFDSDQVSMFLGNNYLITFQEKEGDCFNPVRDRIRSNRGKVCHLGPDYLVYSMIDSVVDAYFPVLEHFGERLEDLEDVAVSKPAQATVHAIHEVKRELLIMRRSVWPAREALGTLVRDHSPLITDETRVYLRDAYDHLVQIIEIMENYRELGSDLMDIYLSAMSHKLNEVMKVLTIIATIFMPLSFIVGIYGMNFETKYPLNMPELGWRYGYLFVWVVILATAGGLLTFFYRRGWIGRGNWKG